MEALTKRQKIVFDNLCSDNRVNWNRLAKMLGVKRQAVFIQLQVLIRKGYVVKDVDGYKPTVEGVEYIMHNPETKHVYWDNHAYKNQFTKTGEQVSPSQDPGPENQITE